MNSVTNRVFMAKKKMYKNPKTEIMTVNTEYMMEDLTLSSGGPGSGQMDAPARRGDLIP